MRFTFAQRVASLPLSSVWCGCCLAFLIGSAAADLQDVRAAQSENTRSRDQMSSESSERPAQPMAPLAVTRQRVAFKSGNLTLVGYVFKPEGPGPFPAILWNHGSEPNPDAGPQFDTVANSFVPAGYVVFAPMRRGHGASEGAYIARILDLTRRVQGVDGANREMVRLMDSEQLDDQLAGLSYLKSLPYVDGSRLVVAGCSYGGIESLLAAERNTGYKAAIAISPAALSWLHNPALRTRLLQGVRNINIPVLILQPAKDASLEPSRVLGAEFGRRGKRYFGKVYPPVGPVAEQAHCFGGAKGTHVWAQDALTFLEGTLQ
jgi:carboxymethylenebutenolidase